MRYVILDKGSRVIDILIVSPRTLYPNMRYIAVADEVQVGVGMVYDEETDTFSEYVEPAQEPTQADRIEANLDYLVLLNS